MVDQLQSSQEEADTRILLHAKHHASDNGYKYVLVVSEDNGVYVPTLHCIDKGHQ